MTTIEDLLPTWRDRVEDWRASALFEGWRANTDNRTQTRDALLDWLDRLRTGRTNLEDARIEFDLRTRTEWSSWGMKGASGAMFLNMLGKHLSDHEEVVERLVAAIALPESGEQAGDRIRGLCTFLEARIAAGDASRAQVQPRRAAFFLSSLWNVQDAERPVYWRSALAAFVADGLLQRVDDRADDYVSFHNVYRALCDALGLTARELEGVCWWWEDHARKKKELEREKKTAPALPPVIADHSGNAADGPGGDRERTLGELFLDADTIEQMISLLTRKRNLILQGPPGTGKTFVASRLAKVLANPERQGSAAQLAG